MDQTILDKKKEKTILCDQQDCEFNKSEKCLKEHITLCNIKNVSQDFWFACFDYSGKQSLPLNKKINGKFYCTAKNRKQQFSCSAGKIDKFDDHCQHGLNICLIGRMKTQIMML